MRLDFQNEILNAIQNLPNPRSGANLAAGLEMLMMEVFKENRGARSSVPNLAILVTATQSDRRQDDVTALHAAANEHHTRGVLVRITEVQETNPDALNCAKDMGLAVILVDHFRDLGSVVDDVLEESCQELGT